MSDSLIITARREEGFNPHALAAEVERIEGELECRRRELSEMQVDFRVFKIRYAQIVGARLVELDGVEQAIKKAEAELPGIDSDDEKTRLNEAELKRQSKQGGQTTLRKLFWSVAKLFHPDHALDESEARRRHTIMVEASRAYGEGDLESLHLLLGDESLRSHCRTNTETVTTHQDPDLHRHLLNLQEELRTIEFGIKRIKEDSLYQLKLKTDEVSQSGRDPLLETARQIERQIIKARHRLEHLSSQTEC